MKPIYHTCPICNISFKGSRGRIYCSRKCYLSAPRQSAWNKGLVGLPANRPKNGITKECPCCGQAFYVPKCYSNKKYCSMECYHDNRWGGSRAETRSCIICDSQFTVTRSVKKMTCSNKCKQENKSISMRGEKSHLWRGGATAPYNGDWRFIREQVRKRDGYKCTICNSTDRIQVHHIIPYRYSKSHALNNLITLCRSCHSREEIRVNQACAEGLKQRWRAGKD